jgi:hypothetical protein
MLLSLCIPCVDTRFTYQYIRSTIAKTNLGIICNIKESNSYTKCNSKKVFVTMRVDDNNEYRRQLVERLEQGKNIKIMHQEPYYWKMVQCK